MQKSGENRGQPVPQSQPAFPAAHSPLIFFNISEELSISHKNKENKKEQRQQIGDINKIFGRRKGDSGDDTVVIT